MCEKNEKYSVLKQACIEWNKSELEKYENVEIDDSKFSKEFKRQLNRMGREKIGLKNALHPEVDNLFERTRSKIMYWWKYRHKAKK